MFLFKIARPAYTLMMKVSDYPLLMFYCNVLSRYFATSDLSISVTYMDQTLYLKKSVLDV